MTTSTNRNNETGPEKVAGSIAKPSGPEDFAPSPVSPHSTEAAEVRAMIDRLRECVGKYRPGVTVLCGEAADMLERLHWQPRTDSTEAAELVRKLRGLHSIALIDRPLLEQAIDWIERHDGQQSEGWTLSAEPLNRLQHESIDRAIHLCRGAHYTNLHIRIDGQWKVLEADWMKHLQRTHATPEGQK